MAHNYMNKLHKYLEMARPKSSFDINELEKMYDEMTRLIHSAERLVRKIAKDNHADIIAKRAEAYWIGHIKEALGSEMHSSHTTTMLNTIEDFKDGVDEDEEDEE